MKTQGTVQIDGIDKIILNGLMQDARMSINQLAKQVGISGTAVHQRLKKLERLNSFKVHKSWLTLKNLATPPWLLWGFT